MGNNRGIALLLVFMVIVVLAVLGAGIYIRSIHERTVSLRSSDTSQAVWLAEAGINDALIALRSSFTTSNCSRTTGAGGYAATITALNSTARFVSSRGYVNIGSGTTNATVEAIMACTIPPNFFGNAIYSAGDVTFNGNAYTVKGNVIYAGTISGTTGVTGTVTQDPSISPLARFNFSQLYSIAAGQKNVYAPANGGKYNNVITGATNVNFPSSFWYNQSASIPNVVYIDGDLTLNGNIGTIGGFFLVVGNVINTPDEIDDATINGHGQIQGCIYTRGNFRVNGGGGNLNVNGGVWAGELARLNGNAEVDYNSTYMNAIQNDLNLSTVVQIISWRDATNPYKYQ